MEEKAIRVLVANRPRLMRELVLSIFADQSDIQIVGEVVEDAQIPETVEQTLPDLLVIALDDPSKRPSICDALLRRYPRMRIIALASDRNLSVYYWTPFDVLGSSLDIHAFSFEASEESILETVRRGIHQQEGTKQ
jgi:AmiR/NasT family two-component response regulator